MILFTKSISSAFKGRIDKNVIKKQTIFIILIFSKKYSRVPIEFLEHFRECPFNNPIETAMITVYPFFCNQKAYFSLVKIWFLKRTSQRVPMLHSTLSE
ncbi:hypothetical protein LEP1GSC108_2284 [Leptospira weilii str. UI 13098]|uniref:Uncharacterized protein n=1 Tax=Leptospira weilii str. UI 13098 TaxID=1088542 RepID=M6QPK7_9LEPT|nr:hypothetical protein LEP1GSC108_2284 [Leptospira weilii str. UI 13098]